MIKLHSYFEVTPQSRLDNIIANNVEVREACDGILPTYRSICDFYEVAPVEYLVWDLKNIFHDENTVDFSRYTDNSLSPLGDKQVLLSFLYPLWIS
jgi:hypothetical protein